MCLRMHSKIAKYVFNFFLNFSQKNIKLLKTINLIVKK